MDYLKDQNPVNFTELRSKLSEPEYVKSASESADALTSREFADSSRSEYPINNAGSTYLSKVYFEANKHNLDKVAHAVIAGGLSKAARLYKIEADFEAIEGALANIKSASSKKEDTYALQFEKSGSVQSYYLVNDEEDVRESARTLANDFHKMPVDWFRKAATVIVKKAEELNVPSYAIPSKIRSVGTERQIDFDYAEKVLGKRAKRVDADTAELYNEIFKSAKHDSENLDQYITLVADLDRANNIDYNHHEDPFAAFYSSYRESDIEKLASERININDVPVPTEVFTKIAEEDLRAHFNKKDSEQLLNLQKKASTTSVKVMSEISAEFATIDSAVKQEVLQLCLKND